MELRSIENSSETAQPTSKITADVRLSRGPVANTSCQQEVSGLSQTLIPGASTAATSALFHVRSFDTASARYGPFLRKCLSHSASCPVLAALTAAIAWSGHFTTIPLSLLLAAFLYKAQSRAQAYGTLFFYYIGASWPLIPGAKNFFGAQATNLDGIPLCLGAAALLAIPSALLFTRKK